MLEFQCLSPHLLEYWEHFPLKSNLDSAWMMLQTLFYEKVAALNHARFPSEEVKNSDAIKRWVTAVEKRSGVQWERGIFLPK